MKREDQVALLVGLLTCYSPTEQENEAVNYLVEKMQSLGYTTTVDRTGNAVGWIGDGPHEILLLGHIDTVPGFIQVHTEGEILWGRGAVDAKGPLAAFVCAGASVHVPDGWRVTVIGAVGEEGDSRGAKALLDRLPPQATIIGEPSGWDRVTLGYKGSAWFQYTEQRPQAHPASGNETASEAAVKFWQNIENEAAIFNAGKVRVFDQLKISLRGMYSDQNGFEDTARLTVGARLPPGLSVQAAEDILSRWAVGGELRLSEGIPAYRADKNTPLVRSLLSAIRKYGGRPGFTLKSGTSDMNLVGPVWNCPMVAYGPGDSRLDHTPDEQVSLGEYLSGVDVLVTTLQQLMDWEVGGGLPAS